MSKVVLILLTAASFITATAQSPKSRENYEKELDYFTEKINHEPDSIINYYLRATLKRGNFQASNADSKKVLDLYLSNPSQKYAKLATDACYYLADDYYFRNSDRTNAEVYINQGLSITPEDKRFEVLQTGILSTYPEKEEEARWQFESLISKYPEDEKILLYYGKFLAQNDMEKAILCYAKVEAMNPFNVDALFALGSYYTNEAKEVYQATGDARKGLELSKKGLGYFETIHLLKPDDKDIIEILIQCYTNMDLDAEREKMELKLRQ